MRGEVINLSFCCCVQCLPEEHPSRADRPAGKAAIASCSRLGRSEVFMRLAHDPRAQSQGRNTIGRLEQRGAEKGRVIDVQTSIGAV